MLINKMKEHDVFKIFSNIQPMKHYPAYILISPSSVTAADTIHMTFSTHALIFITGY